MRQQKTVTVTLDYPMELPDGTKTEITMRRPTMGDILSYPIKGEADVEGEMRLYCALTGLAMDDIKLVDVEDYNKLQVTYSSFRPNTK